MRWDCTTGDERRRYPILFESDLAICNFWRGELKDRFHCCTINYHNEEVTYPYNILHVLWTWSISDLTSSSLEVACSTGVRERRYTAAFHLQQCASVLPYVFNTAPIQCLNNSCLNVLKLKKASRTVWDYH